MFYIIFNSAWLEKDPEVSISLLVYEARIKSNEILFDLTLSDPIL